MYTNTQKRILVCVCVHVRVRACINGHPHAHAYLYTYIYTLNTLSCASSHLIKLNREIYKQRHNQREKLHTHKIESNPFNVSYL